LSNVQIPKSSWYLYLIQSSRSEAYRKAVCRAELKSFFLPPGGSRPHALLTCDTMSQWHYYDSARSARVGPAHMLYSHLRHYVTVALLQQCDTMSHCYVGYLL